jgi:hypothetical protein
MGVMCKPEQSWKKAAEYASKLHVLTSMTLPGLCNSSSVTRRYLAQWAIEVTYRISYSMPFTFIQAAGYWFLADSLLW